MSGGFYGGDDSRVRAAPAQVAIQVFDDLAGTRIRGVEQQAIRGHQHAWRTEPALKGLMFDEGLLKRVKPVWLAEPFNRADVFTGQRADGRLTRPDAAAIDEHCACAAQPVTAAEFGAGQPEVRAEHPQESSILVDGEALPLAVQRE